MSNKRNPSLAKQRKIKRMKEKQKRRNNQLYFWYDGKSKVYEVVRQDIVAWIK